MIDDLGTGDSCGNEVAGASVNPNTILDHSSGTNPKLSNVDSVSAVGYPMTRGLVWINTQV